MKSLRLAPVLACLVIQATSACHSQHVPPDLTRSYTPNLEYSTIEFRPATFHDQDRPDVVPVLLGRATELRYCYDRQIQRDPRVGSGEVIVLFDIGARGDVRLVEVEDRGVDADVALCIASRVRGLKFAPSGRMSSRVTLPIALTRPS